MDEHGDEDQIMMEHDDEDSDDCFESNNANKAPSWARLPSEETEYSDWQIDVEFAGALELTGYLVHRYRIGPSSDYFKSMFRDEYGFAESNRKRCVIKFPKDMPVDVDREHFELFLDYLYCDGAWKWEELKILPLLYLSDYFGVESLRAEIIKEFEHNLNMADHSSFEWIVGTYRLADSLSLKDIQFKIEELFCCNHVRFYESWDCMESDDLKSRLFHGMYRAQKNNIDLKNYFWHSIVGHVIESNPNIVDKDLFAELTLDLVEKKDMIGLNGKQAIDYLKHERRLFLDGPESDSLTPLQEWCVRWLLWEFCNDMLPKPCEMVIVLGTLKPAIMRSFFGAAVAGEKEEVLFELLFGPSRIDVGKATSPSFKT